METTCKNKKRIIRYDKFLEVSQTYKKTTLLSLLLALCQNSLKHNANAESNETNHSVNNVISNFNFTYN